MEMGDLHERMHLLNPAGFGELTKTQIRWVHPPSFCSGVLSLWRGGLPLVSCRPLHFIPSFTSLYCGEVVRLKMQCYGLPAPYFLASASFQMLTPSHMASVSVCTECTERDAEY